MCYIEYLTWPEAEGLLSQSPLCLIPLGARTKEHGFHLPLNNDFIMAEYLTRRVNAVIDLPTLPTVQYGYYPAFLEYPGSVSINLITFRDTIVDICRSIARHGPRKFYVLNTGVSTNRGLEPARKILLDEGIHLEYTNLLVAKSEVVESVRTQEAGTHADEIETSMMMYMAPDIVRFHLAKRDIHPDKGPGGLTRNENYETGVYSPTGAWGDPTLATIEKGKAITEGLIDYLVGFLREFQKPEFQPTPFLTQYLPV
jgi:creatinine amidohydrolase